jgi:hypothetical protein
MQALETWQRRLRCKLSKYLGLGSAQIPCQPKCVSSSQVLLSKTPSVAPNSIKNLPFCNGFAPAGMVKVSLSVLSSWGFPALQGEENRKRHPAGLTATVVLQATTRNARSPVVSDHLR